MYVAVLCVRVGRANLILRPSRDPMASMDWVNCIYASRRFVGFLSHAVKDFIFQRLSC